MTSSTRLESSVQKEILDWLRAQDDIFVLRINANGLGNKGISDCICCICGFFVAIEFKRDIDGAYGVTKPQEIRGRQIQKANGIWFATDSLDDVKERVQSFRATLKILDNLIYKGEHNGL